MKEIAGKRLLLLGGINHAMEIIKAAQEMGVLVFVTDYYESTPAKQIADKAFTISTTDVDAVVSCKIGVPLYVCHTKVVTYICLKDMVGLMCLIFEISDI